MVAFDAGVPTPVDQSRGEPVGRWLGWSKPITQPEPDRSGETLGKTIGGAIEHAAEIGSDTAQYASETGSADILKENQARLDQFAQDQGLPTGSLLGPRAQADVPPDVRQAQNTADVLGSAKANGAISNTYYLGQLDKYASDMRSRFPMFAQAIDRGIAKSTGVTHTANELYQSTLKDINTFLTKKDDYDKGAQTSLIEAVRQNIPGAALQLKMFHAGQKSADDIYDWVEKNQSHEHATRDAKGDIELKKLRGGEVSDDAERLAYADMFTRAATQRNLITQSLGFKGGWDEVQQHLNNPTAYDPQVVQAAQNAQLSAQAQMRSWLTSQMLAPTTDRKGNITGPSYASRMPDKWEGIVNNLMKPMETQTQMFANKDYSPVAALNRLDDAAKAKMQHYVSGTRLGSAVMAYDILKKAGADQLATKLLTDQLGKDGIDDDLRQFGMVALGTSWMTPGQIPQMGPGVKQHDMKTDIDNYVKKYGKDNGINMFIEDLKNIQSSNIPDENKIAKIKYAYGFSNADVIRSWQRMGLQPTDMKPDKPGADRWNIFAQMYSPEALKEIKRLSDAHTGGKLWDEVKSTAFSQFAGMFGQNIRDLNQLPYFNMTYHSDETKGIHRFDIAPDPKGPEYSGASITAGRLLSEKINTGINRIADIARAEGRDPDVFIYNFLKDQGYDFSDHPKNAGEGMMNALSSTYAAEKDALKKAKEKLLEQGRRK